MGEFRFAQGELGYTQGGVSYCVLEGSFLCANYFAMSCEE